MCPWCVVISAQQAPANSAHGWQQWTLVSLRELQGGTCGVQVKRMEMEARSFSAERSRTLLVKVGSQGPAECCVSPVATGGEETCALTRTAGQGTGSGVAGQQGL